MAELDEFGGFGSKGREGCCLMVQVVEGGWSWVELVDGPKFACWLARAGEYGGVVLGDGDSGGIECCDASGIAHLTDAE